MDKKKATQCKKKKNLCVKPPQRMRVQVTEIKDSNEEETKDVQDCMVRVETRKIGRGQALNFMLC